MARSKNTKKETNEQVVQADPQGLYSSPYSNEDGSTNDFQSAADTKAVEKAAEENLKTENTENTENSENSDQ